MELDPRWQNVYASTKPYSHIHEFGEEAERELCYLCTCTELKLEVEYRGKTITTRQIIDDGDVRDMQTIPEAFKFYWEQLIQELDKKLKRFR